MTAASSTGSRMLFWDLVREKKWFLKIQRFAWKEPQCLTTMFAAAEILSGENELATQTGQQTRVHLSIIRFAAKGRPRSVTDPTDLNRQNGYLSHLSLQWSAVRVTPSGNPRDLNFSKTAAGITKWFWVTTEGYLSYLLPKFKDLIPTSLGDIAI